MPKQKERLVYKGPIFTVYQWRQRMFDGSYKIFERIERPASVQILPIVGRKIATTIESQPNKARFHGFFGGRIEDGESPMHAAKRELLEESGMAAKRWKLLRKFVSPTKKYKFEIYLYAAIDCKKVAEQKLDGGERIKTRMITPEKLLNQKNVRITGEMALYFTEIRHNKLLRKKFMKAIGLS